MNLNNLKRDACPLCNETLDSAIDPDSKVYRCQCGFYMTKEAVANMKPGEQIIDINKK